MNLIVFGLLCILLGFGMGVIMSGVMQALKAEKQKDQEQRREGDGDLAA
jgi:predicted phage tail protein